MARTKEQNEQMRNASRDTIIDTAISVFSKKGFSATTTKDISNIACISEGLIYRYFKSKQDLFDKIIEMAVRGLQRLTLLANNSNTPKETFEMICQHMIDSLNDESYLELSSMITQGLMSQENNVFEEIQSADEQMLDAFANLIKKGQEQGVFAEGDSIAKACLFLSTVQGMTLMKSVFKEKFKPPTSMDMMSFLLKGENNGSNN